MTFHMRPGFYVLAGQADMIPGFEETGHMSGQKFRSEQKSAQKSENDSGQASATGCNPHQVHREFPDRWAQYIRTNYQDLHHVMRVFWVSERTARKWWSGETGASGGYVAIAVNEHPVAAPRMLFAAE